MLMAAAVKDVLGADADGTAVIDKDFGMLIGAGEHDFYRNISTEQAKLSEVTENHG
jgi:hypothetical protein